MTAKGQSHTPLWRKIVKVCLWTAMAVMLAFVAVVMCLVSLISDENLTVLTSRAANKLLDADVKIGRVDFSLSGRMPLLRLEVDSVTIVSDPMLRLSDDVRATLPAWGDTLLTLKHFEGGLSMSALLRGKIDLYDVEFEEPEVNILSVNDSLGNYLIYESQAVEEEPDTSAVSMPEIAINHFTIKNPGPMRYHNAMTGENFNLRLKTFDIDGSDNPSYALAIDGDMAMPLPALCSLDKLRFGANGSIVWNPEKPMELALEDFAVFANFIKSRVSAHIDFTREIIVHDYSLELSKTRIEDIVSLLPDSMRIAYGLQPERFSTDCAVDFTLNSTAPFNPAADSIPSADIEMNITPGQLRYDKAVFKNVSGKFKVGLHGNDLNAATVEVCDLNVAGPATDLTLNVKASQLMSDALVTGSVSGSSDLVKLPVQLRRLAKGYLKGLVTVDLQFEGRPSMLTRNSFHKLNLRGDIDLHKFYYLSSDTAMMLDVNNACFKFGTKTEIRSNSFLTAKVSVDSANIRQSEYSMKVSDFSLGVGVSNRAPSADTTVVVPMGGDLKVGKFYFTVLGDSIACFLRKGHGRVSMKRYNNEARRPLFGLDLNVASFATGTPEVRFMISEANINASGYKLDRPKMPRAIQKTADSIRTVYPDIPVDSVYAKAIRLVNERRRSRHPGARQQVADSSEVIYWGTSGAMRKLLLGWQLNGSIKADRAGLYTPYFPVRNRVRNFNMAFNNDSIVFTNVSYNLGASDFLISGKVANIRRGFTSRGYRSPIRLNFELLSDTIDVNEIASATFRGSAYAAMRESAGLAQFSIDSLEHDEREGDEAFERELGEIVTESPDSLAPLIVPKNINANLKVRARNILYSDLLFHDFKGELLASHGALNLHELRAASSNLGAINMSALYSSPHINDIKFGFGMQVERFNIERFIKLMPAIDSIMPLLRDLGGIVDADIAATCDIDRGMNLLLPSLEAAIRISGDSLELIDPETYRYIGKWLLFKNKQNNVIKHMNVEMTIKDNMMQLYPFIFDLDRYKLGVQGRNDLNLNFDYHIAVLRSPLPFRFGINLKGNPDNYKVRLGKARLNESQAAQNISIVDTTRVNLLSQIENVFRRGISNSRFARLGISSAPPASRVDLNSDTISHTDSLLFIKEGLIPAPLPPVTDDAADDKGSKKKQKKDKRKKDKKRDKDTELIRKETLWVRK